ncbi:MAG: hypothetical protein ABI647_01525 [Gemmatimonadota bacterium]
MLGSGVLDTAIGLVFVFLLVSMLVTIGNEMIAAALLSRAKWLRKGIDRLLESDWAQKLYAHPLIEGSAAVPSSKAPGSWTIRGTGPSYIPSRSFANVLLDLVRQSKAIVPGLTSVKASLEKLTTEIAVSREELRARLRAAIDSIPATLPGADAIKKDLTGLLDRLKADTDVRGVQADIRRFIDRMAAGSLREAIEQFPGERIRKTLLLLLDDAEGDFEKFKENIEVWFNNAMDRVGGWYKRRSQWVVAVLGLVVAIWMNVDTIHIIKHLETHPGLRDALVAQASAYAESGSPVGSRGKGGQPSQKPDSGAPRATANAGEPFEGELVFTKPATAAGSVTLTSSDQSVTLREPTAAVDSGATHVKFALDLQPSTTASDLEITAAGAGEGAVAVHINPSLDAQFSAVQAQLKQLNLPFGWVLAASNQSEVANRQVVPWAKGATWGDTIEFHFLGWLLTALAASLGAPFWFDLLNRFILIRSAGKAPEEKPKPPKNVPAPLEPGQSPREADAANAGK